MSSDYAICPTCQGERVTPHGDMFEYLEACPVCGGTGRIDTTTIDVSPEEQKISKLENGLRGLKRHCAIHGNGGRTCECAEIDAILGAI